MKFVHTKTKPSFWANVQKSDTGCWLWTGLRQIDSKGNETGYGRVGPYYAHRLVAKAMYGVAAGRHVLHSCDNKGCVRPEHLRYGSHAENMREAKQRGLLKDPPRHGDGEEHPRAKLTNGQVLEILEMRESGISMSKLAAAFGVSKSTIEKVVYRKSYLSATTSTKTEPR